MNGLPPDVEDLVDLGYDVIPIAPGSKDMISGLTGWQKRPPAELWRDDRVSPDCNRALRHGGELQLASVEVEHDATPEQAASVTRYLAGLGLYPDGCPVVNSYRGFPRFFLRLLDAPATGNSRKMHADFGGGEVRYGRGAYSVIPPSRVDSRPYTLVSGDYRQLPPVYLADVAPLLADGRKRDAATPELAPTELSAFAQAIIDGENVLPADVRKRLRGIGGTDYPSVDDFTTVYRLAALGIDADTTLALLRDYDGYGYFSALKAEDRAAAVTWLHDAYSKASAYIAANGSDVSQRLARLIAQAERETWPGRTGATDKAVYLAHLRIAHDANTPVWAGASRRLADMVNVGRATATRANYRLIESGKLALHTPPTAQLAAEYTLPTEDKVQSGTLLYVGDTKRSVPLCTRITAEDEKSVCVLPLSETERETERQRDDTQRPPEPEAGRVQSPSGARVLNQNQSSSTFAHPRRTEGTQAILGHDLFCWKGLGKATGLVFAALLDAPGTVKELAERSGRNVSTVRRALSKLAAITDDATGEQYALVEEDGAGTWEIADSADMDKAARLLGVAGIGDKRKAKHAAEQQRNKAALEDYREGEDGKDVPRRSSPNRGKRLSQAEVIRQSRQKTHTERIGTPEAEEFRLQAEAML